MRTEPTAIIEVIRLVAIVLGLFGVVITLEEQAVIAAGIGAVIALISVGLAIWNRLSVFSPKTVDKIAARSAAAGVPIVGDPPAGTPRTAPDDSDQTLKTRGDAP